MEEESLSKPYHVNNLGNDSSSTRLYAGARLGTWEIDNATKFREEPTRGQYITVVTNAINSVILVVKLIILLATGTRPKQSIGEEPWLAPAIADIYEGGDGPGSRS